MKRNRILALILVAAGIAGMALSVGGIPALDLTPLTGSWEVELAPGEFTTIVDEKGNVLDRMSRVVYVGDEYVNEGNWHYRVEKVVGNTAHAVLIGREEVASKVDTTAAFEIEQAAAEGESKNDLIAIYHTHSDECYVPTDGTQSNPGGGGVFQVGDALTKKLRSLGVKVTHSEAGHEPHDANSYRRSRRTAVKLLQKNPASIIDVHRDGVPDPNFYNTTVDGKNVAQVRFVIGRQNQNMQANYDYAKRLKGYLDDKHPGLVKGIYLGKGNYNQDLSPRSILVEAGTYTEPKGRAEKGIELFADALPPVLGIAGGTSALQQSGVASAGDKAAIIFVIAALIIGVAAYLVISTGSVRGAVDKLKKFVTVEWTNFLGRMPARSRNGKGQKKD